MATEKKPGLQKEHELSKSFLIFKIYFGCFCSFFFFFVLFCFVSFSIFFFSCLLLLILFFYIHDHVFIFVMIWTDLIICYFTQLLSRLIWTSFISVIVVLHDGSNSGTNLQAWFERGIPGSHGDTTWGSRTAASSTFSFTKTGSADALGQDSKLESTYLYIQMEYCPR